MNLSRFRRGHGEIANHVIDEFAAGRLNRREFIRRGTVVGISITALDGILTACGSSPSSSSPSASSSASSAPGKAGATINAGIEHWRRRGFADPGGQPPGTAGVEYAAVGRRRRRRDFSIEPDPIRDHAV